MSQAGFEPPFPDDISYEADALPTKPPRLDDFLNIYCYKKSSRGSTFHKNHSYWRFGFSYQIHQNSVVPTRQAYFIFHFLEIILCRFSENIFVVPIFKLIFFSNSVSRAQNLKQWGSENQTLDIQKHSKTGDFTFCS